MRWDASPYYLETSFAQSPDRNYYFGEFGDRQSHSYWYYRSVTLVRDLAAVVAMGNILNEGRLYMVSAWWVVVLPGIMSVLTVLGVNLFCESLRGRYDPRSR